ncbi:MAG: hypothetical protein GJ680_07795 [Alteromonadaceae bacterium]|nr:hypothetical protein [Alteromonadaceae bacterium]
MKFVVNQQNVIFKLNKLDDLAFSDFHGCRLFTSEGALKSFYRIKRLGTFEELQASIIVVTQIAENVISLEKSGMDRGVAGFPRYKDIAVFISDYVM